MIYFLWALAAGSLIPWLVAAVAFAISRFNPPRLLALPADGPVPRLTVIAPACNEEETVDAAMKTLLAVDYPDLEIIAVDDRSTDRTGSILDALSNSRPAAGEERSSVPVERPASREERSSVPIERPASREESSALRVERLRVVHVRELPPGWLGKNHALHVASQQATGDFILFTDADVRFEPTALRRAVRYAVDRNLDQLCVFPDLELEAMIETATVGVFGMMYLLHTGFSSAADPRSKSHIGIGAFNLVRAAFYRTMGGHASLPLDVLDDVKLGKRLKESGARVGIAIGTGAVRVRWIAGIGGFVRGMTKNLFSAFRYSLVRTFGGILVVLLMCCWPVAGVFLGPLGPRLLCGATLLAMVVGGAVQPIARGLRRLNGLFFPLGGVVFCAALIRSAVLTLARGGIEWRGTFYALKDLRKGLV